MSKTQATPLKRPPSTAASKAKTKTPSKSVSKASTKTPTKKRKRPSEIEAEDDGSSFSEDETFQTAPSPFTSSPVKSQLPISAKAKKVRFDDLNGAAPAEPVIEDEDLDLDEDEDDDDESDSDDAPEAESTSQSAMTAQARIADSQRAGLAQRDEKRRRNRDVNEVLTMQAEKRRSRSKAQAPSTTTPTPTSNDTDATADAGASTGSIDTEIARFLLPDGTLPNVLPDELIELFARDEQARLLSEIKDAQAAKRMAQGQPRRKIVFKDVDTRDVKLNGKMVRVLRKEGLHPPKSSGGRVKSQWLEDRKGRGRVVKRSGGFAKR